ncbi:MAG: RNA-directed DNA polymerase [Treponema sp.]|jgi:hypothetical protein|nr:RNA-directed DNA polymerase [Treponema sp.]
MSLLADTMQPLNINNLILQLINFGYFAEQVPTCFGAKRMTEYLDVLVKYIKDNEKGIKKNSTGPTTLSIYKNDISRRVLSLPNPKSFLYLCNLMQKHWNEIQKYCESINSLSPITYIHIYNDIPLEMINSESIRESNHSKSAFVDGVKNCIKASLGYKYRLKVDIANCYNSIYTHSISWAICGKNEAKQYFRTKNPKTLKNAYEIADNLDAAIRNQKNNETNGILTGPFTSRIISEIILCALDKKLREKGFCFRRYVDDYKFYFRTEFQAQGSLPAIENILNEYNLNLNITKTAIERFPFEIISDIKEKLKIAFEEGGVFEVLNVASQLYFGGEKGAYKYALKYIREKEPIKEDFQFILPLLINIMLIEPKNARFVIVYLIRFASYWNRNDVEKTINDELSNSLNTDLQQETLTFIQMVKELKLNLYAKNFILILKSQNDFAIIIALDLWKNRKKSIKGKPTELKKIPSALKELSDSLKGEIFSGSRWLILHEIRLHKLLRTNLIPSPPPDDFFDLLFDNGISFYKEIRDTVEV